MKEKTNNSTLTAEGAKTYFIRVSQPYQMWEQQFSFIMGPTNKDCTHKLCLLPFARL
ncbi:hypothetical protein MTR_7g100750 [Medicago truncatula]|uniref:Uncharacterized protein n=1 Tax=Medicago truncatula TaxID=3880 RepID=G7L1R2_MEDTR|nr:hypothetical protein MTR_7g100750 [Medicago truncatula]